MEFPTTHIVEGHVSPLGDEIDSSVVCVLTRFSFRNPWAFFAMYRHYRRVTAQARASSDGGLLKSTLFVDGVRSCFTISIWRRATDIPRFGTAVPTHVDAARHIFGLVEINDRGPVVWSTKWRLVAASNNLNWGELDWRAAFAQAPASFATSRLDAR